MYMAGMVFLPPGMVLPYGISLVQNYGKYPRLHHLSMTELFFFAFKTKKIRKNIWRFHGKYVPLHSQSSKCFNSSVG